MTQKPTYEELEQRVWELEKEAAERKAASEERKIVEPQLQETQKVEAIATLAVGIAHEFNNALVGVYGNIDLLQMDLSDDENIDEYVREMRDSTHRMAQLTNQLLAYFGRAKYQLKTISLNDFVEDSLPAVEVQELRAKETKTEVATGSGTALVIEDDDVVIDVIRPMLERLGYRVLLAKSGTEAVDIARTFDGDIDLALLDIVLPDMGGKEVYPLIMEAQPNLKVIVCTGCAIDGPAQEIVYAGARGFIQKPFSLETLSHKLRKVLEGKIGD